MKPTHPVPFIWESGVRGRCGVSLPEPDVPDAEIPASLIRGELLLPEKSELEVVRHFMALSQENFSIDTNFYPLGSCTMKYNPKVNEKAATLSGFQDTHPLLPESLCQGSMEVMYNLQQFLAEIAGFEGVSVQPAAGAQGELAGVLMIRAYHKDRGDLKRTNMLIPDSAHGTNPASVAMAGFKAVEIPSGKDGLVDPEVLEGFCDDTVAGIMITNPNTLGLFEKNIIDVIRIVHKAGGLVYGDGANLNALMGIVKPGKLGIDVMHFNLHKTFSTPHGGGGPGAGPVGAGERLLPYLPGPVVVKEEGSFRFVVPEHSIGRLKSFYGNFGILVRAYTYIRMLGAQGLKDVSMNAVLNANYLKALIEKTYPVKYPGICMHEFVASPPAVEGIHTVDIAKRLIDYGFHPPTVYFPLIVKEAIMLEPTETESKETLDTFAQTLLRIAEEAERAPELLKEAPHHTPVKRLDEVQAARTPVLRCLCG